MSSFCLVFSLAKSERCCIAMQGKYVFWHEWSVNVRRSNGYEVGTTISIIVLPSSIKLQAQFGLSWYQSTNPATPTSHPETTQMLGITQPMGSQYQIVSSKLLASGQLAPSQWLASSWLVASQLLACGWPDPSLCVASSKLMDSQLQANGQLAPNSGSYLSAVEQLATSYWIASISCAELGTAQPQLVFVCLETLFFLFFFIEMGLHNFWRKRIYIFWERPSWTP